MINEAVSQLYLWVASSITYENGIWLAEGLVLLFIMAFAGILLFLSSRHSADA